MHKEQKKTQKKSQNKTPQIPTFFRTFAYLN